MDVTSAWSRTETRHAWRRAAAWGLGWLVVGLTFLTVFVLFADTSESAAQRLRDTGIKISATALADSPVALRCGQVPVPIRFEVDGIEHSDQLYVDGCGGQLIKGEQVPLYVDPADVRNSSQMAPQTTSRSSWDS